MIRFAAGFITGILTAYWLLARAIATPERAAAPHDVYQEQLAAILEAERW